MQNTKRSLWTSVTALLLCFVMLIGTTFAWFTDEVSSANNIIKAGTLDIAMSWSADNANWKDTEGANAKPVFDYDNWEPGYTEVRYIKVHNLGNLAFQYKMAINPTGAVGKLAEVIDVSFDIVTDNASFVAPTADNKQGSLVKVATLADLIAADGIVAGGVLLPDGTEEAGYYDGEIVICISFHMQETAGNEYQGLSIGDAFGINLYATQFDYEKDSFDNSYDDDATWPSIENGAASANIDASNLLLGALTSEVVINGDGISATIPADVKVADGATSLDLTVESATADANISLGDGASATGFNVHIEGIAQDNTKPMIVNLGAILNPALSETELKLYHTENGTPTLMTRVNSAADFAIHNQYTYDPATGEVSIYVASFSVFSAVKTSADVWDGKSVATGFASGTGTENDPYIINTAAQLVYFRNQVDAGVTYAGKFVKLGADIDLADKLFDPIGFGYTYNKESDTAFMGTFDGGNHTIYNLYQNGWDLDPDKTNYSTYTYSTAGGGLFASIENATIKNLVVSGADIKFECVDIGIVVGYAQGNCHFENIVVTNSKIANYNRATGAVVGEVCYGSYGTDITKGYSHTFKNIFVDSSVVVSSLWGSFDTLIGGVIGGKWGDATVKMDNVTVAAELDVYSDVTAAYQWYAYRRCGMLIGHTEQNSPKSALNADAPFLTCENVNVFYGDWVNYEYYQFTNQKDAGGNSLWYNSYPWVRAQAGQNNGAFSNARYGNPIVGGVAINTRELAEENKTAYTPITFNQLYGGGQGVYGKADHDGVVTEHISFNGNNNVTTIFFQNSKGWKNLKLQYTYKNGADTWTTVVDGISLGAPVDTQGVYDIYKVVIPADAYEFTITDGDNKIFEIELDGLVQKDLYYVSGNTVKHRAYTGQYKTVYFQNNWKWTNVNLYYWYSDGSYDVPYSHKDANMTIDHNDGTYDIYKFNIPSNATGFNINGIKNDGSGKRDETPTIQVASVSEDYFYYMNYNNGNEVKLSPKVVYLVLDSTGYWKQSKARFAVYFFNDTIGKNTWVNMVWDEAKQAYKCNVPDGQWEKMIFCRMNPNSSTNDWSNKWNQTGNLTIPSNGNNCGTIKITNSGNWDGSTSVSWSKK